jgi:hypothetical protein
MGAGDSPLDVVTLPLWCEAQEAMLGMIFLARLNLRTLGALLAIVAL